LVYGVEVVWPLEIQILSLHTSIKEDFCEDENHKLQLAELGALDERRL